MKAFIPLILLICTSSWQLLCEESHSFKETDQTGNDLLFFQNGSLFNGWALGGNAAGLLFYKTGHISRAQSQLGTSTDYVKRATDPGQTRSLNISTESIKPVGKFMVRGIFGYQNQHYENIQYNSIMDFRHQNIYSLGDTIMGKQKQEGYYFTAEAAHPFFNERIFAGIAAEYESAVGAKIRDPRNLNTISRLRVNPGFIINLNKLSLGLSGGVILEKNLTTIRVELDEFHSLFNFMGMGHYSAILNISGGQSVRYESEGFQTEIQANLDNQSWSSFQKLTFLKLNTIAFTGTNHRLRDGITDYSQISYTGQWLLKNTTRIHSFNIDAHASTLRGTEIKQVEDIRYINGHYSPVVRTLREIKDKHIIENYSGAMSYQLSGLAPKRLFHYQFSAILGLNFNQTSHFPKEAYGYYNASSFLVNLQYQHFFEWRKINIDPFIGTGGRIAFKSASQIHPFSNQFTLIPEQDFRYFSEDYYKARLGLTLSTTSLPLPSVSRVFLDVNSHYTIYPKIDMDDNYNFSLLFTLGVIF